VFAAAVSATGLNAEAFGAMVQFLHQNGADILSFAAPFPELRAWIEWIINFLDAEQKASKR
jgi:hypothetical protein